MRARAFTPAGFLAAALLAAWAMAASATEAPDDPVRDQRPNILLITADTFRADHMRPWGYPHATTPHLDSLSAEGIVFREAFTTSGWTAPGLISIQTSLYAPAHGVDIRGRSIDPSVTTLAEALRAAGYRAPDIFFLTGIPNFAHLGLEPYADRGRWLPKDEEILFHWLREEADASERPFFLYYHYRDLHQPYNPGEPYESMYARRAWGHRWNPLRYVRRFLADEKVALVKREVMLPRGIIDFASWDKPWVDALYDGELRRMDDRLFARLRRVLREEGLADNTIVVISADHGEELLDHGLIGHASTYKEGRLFDEIIRIPLILWAPGRLPEGLQVDDLVQAIDVMPTILDLVGASTPAGAQGRSLTPLLEGGTLPPRPVFLETSGGGYTATLEQFSRRTRVLRTARWKLTWKAPEDEVTLHDIVADPAEEDDVADDYPAVTDSLRALLTAWVDANPKIKAPPAPPEPAADAGGAADREGAVRVMFPADGDTLEYVGAKQTIQLEWTGPPGANYTAEYEIGRGAYHLEGELEVDSSTPSYGPYHPDFWNSLVLYNPWRFRVYPKGQPEMASGWVTFHLAPSGDGGLSLSGWASVAAARVADTTRDLVSLALGLALGLVDLGVWLAGIPPADAAAWALLAAIAGALAWPRLQPLGEARLRAWGLAIAYVGLVYATVPVFPTVWVTLRGHAGDSVSYLGILGVLGAAVWVSRLVIRRARADGAPLRLLGLVAALGAYAWLLAIFGRFPAERLHLLEYGLMAFLLFRALRLDLRPAAAHAAALAATAVLGFGDETIQWVLPQRFFELKDVGLNVVAGSLGLMLTALAVGRGRGR